MTCRLLNIIVNIEFGYFSSVESRVVKIFFFIFKVMIDGNCNYNRCFEKIISIFKLY